MITIIVIINVVITFTCDGNVAKIVMESHRLGWKEAFWKKNEIPVISEKRWS